MNQIDLYNGKGYVRIIDHMGSDLSFTRAARASFAKDSPEWNSREEKLLRFLYKEKHMSVFRHAAVTYQIKAPLFVARQHFKYQVASAHLDDQNGWNEMSKRYVTSDSEFYIPENTQWRHAPENAKQGSGIPLDSKVGDFLTKRLEKLILHTDKLYQEALDVGACAEQARLFLPAYGLMINYQWTVSMANLLHFLQERLASNAQVEITDLAKGIFDLTKSIFPVTLEMIIE